MKKPARKKVKLSEIEKLGALQCTTNEAAAWLRIRRSTFESMLRKDPQIREAWDRGQNRGNVSLRRIQRRLSRTNATMAIFLGKNYLKQREVVVSEHSGPDGAPLGIDLSQLTAEERSELRSILGRASRKQTDSE